MVLLISYDLNGHERPSAYAAVKKMIESNARAWARRLYSQWFVDTNDSVDVWQERIKRAADSNDNWFICRVQRPYKGWLGKSIWEWLDARV